MQTTKQVIDTLPIPVCRLKRYKRRRILCDDLLVESDVGYCASKDWHYFGVKGGLRIAANGMIVQAPLLPARPYNSQFTHDLLKGLPAGTIGSGDKGFLDEDKQSWFKTNHGLIRLPPLKTGMKPNAFQLPTFLKPIRQLIETVKGQLVERFKGQNLRRRKGWT